jgi:NAD(P)-dependent dehydrogenase (short-subunit alcohol dehydrogenase family)
MIPLLEKSKLPKIIFITSSLGSIGALQEGGFLSQTPAYNASKSAVNMLTAYYAKRYPNFKVNACCPGLRATNLHGMELTGEESDPALGAVNAVRLATAGPSTETGTYSNTEGPLPW